jgi:flagellar basal-body rod protein FlgF
MDSGYYAAYTALLSRSEALDTIANNLANANTPGFRAQRNIFSSVLNQTQGTQLNQTINNYGTLSGTTLDTTQGALQKTGNDLDVAIEGPAYLAVQTSGGTMYTRDGSFQISSAGQLVTASGDSVLGNGGAISVPSGAISISEDGTISSRGAIVGKLKLVEFPAGTALTSAGQTYYSAPPNSEIAATQSGVRQGMLESSNVNPVSSMVELITAQRLAEMMQHALSTFNSEMDKTASQELPKVG